MLLPVTNCYVIGQVVAASSIGFSVHGHLPRCPLLRYARPFCFGDTLSPFTVYVHCTNINSSPDSYIVAKTTSFVYVCVVLQILFDWYLVPANSIQLECYAIQLVFYIYISGLMSQNTTNDPVSVSGLYTSAVMHGYDVTLLCVLVARQNTLNVIKSLVWRGEIVITRDYILVWCIYKCICSSSKVFNNHLHTKGEDEKM